MNNKRRIFPDQYIVLFDEEIGIVYAYRKGSLMKTSPEHARAIHDALSLYMDGDMPPNEQRDLEAYLHNSFYDKPDLQIQYPKSLLDRKRLSKVEILLANDCNLRCRYCYAHGGSYCMEKDNLSPEKAIRFLSALIPGRYEEVSSVLFFGGEPTLYPSTIEAICSYFEKLLSRGTLTNLPVYYMVSNGTLIDAKMAAMIKKHSIRVTISIDGPKEINDQLRVDANGQGTFDRILNGIQILHDYGVPPVMIEATYTSKHEKMNYSKEQVCDYLRKTFNVKDVLVADCNEGGPEPELTYFDRDAHLHKDERASYRVARHMCRCLKSDIINSIGCDVAYGSLALLPNGDLFPCHGFIGFNNYRIATYEKDGYSFANYDSVLSRFDRINKFKREGCNNCWAKAICLNCSVQLLLNDEDSVQAGCHSRKEEQKSLMIKCAKLSGSALEDTVNTSQQFRKEVMPC